MSRVPDRPAELPSKDQLQAASALVVRGVDQEEERHRTTLQALGDVDAGRAIDDQAIQAWADSLSTDDKLPPPTA